MDYQASQIKPWLRRVAARVLKPFAALVAASLLLIPAIGTSQQVNPSNVVSLPFSLTANGTTNWLVLNGQSSCTITFPSGNAASTITVQGASDAPNIGTFTPVTVTSIATSGVITNPAAGTSFGGTVSPYALTAIRLSVTGLTGLIFGSISCSNAVLASGSSSSATFSPIPLPVVFQSSQPVSVSNASAIPAAISNTPAVVFPSSQPVSVSNASSIPVAVSNASAIPVSCGVGCAAPINGGATAFPTGTPAAIAIAGANGTTLDSLAESVTPGATPPPNLGILFQQYPVPAVTATALPTHSAGAGAADAICAAACTVYSGALSNNNASTVFCALYNIAAASVNPGTSLFFIPVIVPAGLTVPLYTGPTNGVRFPTAAAVSCTTSFNGSTPVGAGTVNFWAAKL